MVPNMPPPVLLVAPKPPAVLDPKPACFSVSEWCNTLSRSRFNVPDEGVLALAPKPPKPLDCCCCCWLFWPKPPPNPPPNDMMGVRISRYWERVFDARSCPQTMLGYGKACSGKVSELEVARSNWIRITNRESRKEARICSVI